MTSLMNTKTLWVTLLGLLLMTTGCPPVGDEMVPLPMPGASDPDPTPSPGQPNPPEKPVDVPRVTGVWERTNGNFLDYETFGRDLEYLVFSDTGVVTVIVREPESNILMCFESLFSRLSDDALFISNGGSQTEGIRGSQIVFFSMADDDSLELIDDTRGTLTTFRRAAELPEESQCGTLIETGRFDGYPEPHYATGLAFDGTSLFYTADSNDILPIDPTTGAVGTPITLATGSRFVQAVQSDDFWLNCYCSTAEFIKRRTRAGTDVDIVTSAELGMEFFAKAAAFDESEKILYVLGEDESAGRASTILKVNAESEPDVLLDAAPLGYFNIDAATMHDGALFAVLGYPQQIVQIDPATLKAVKSFAIPTEFIEWYGIASVGDDLVMLGENYTIRTDSAVIARFSID